VFGGIQSIRLLAAGILLTLAAVIGREVLPKRTLDLTAPDHKGEHFLFPANDDPNGEKVSWVDEKRFHFRCHYASPDGYQPCTLNFMLTRSGLTQGMDLRGYRSITLDLAYRGNADFVRLGIRTFDPRFSRVEDGNSARMQSINLRARDVAGPVTINLSELAVPEWWIAQFNLPREYNLPSFENATSLAIDLPGQLAGPPHELELRRLELQGEWVSREALYLGILAAWLLGAMGAVVWRLADLRRQHRQQEHEIEALIARTTTLHAEQDDLRRQATVDELTGVLNRRGVEQTIADPAGRSAGMTIILVDVDHFKRVNDTYGHDAGDQVLRRVAAVMAQNVRGGDILGRWGGEEFIVACVNCSAEHAAQVAEKIRQRIEASAFGARQRIPLTASFGVAAVLGEGGFAEALKRADAALYRAKSLGRNRVVVVDDDGDESAGPMAGAA